LGFRENRHTKDLKDKIESLENQVFSLGILAGHTGPTDLETTLENSKYRGLWERFQSRISTSSGRENTFINN
jgi:hypothetical protein